MASKFIGKLKSIKPQKLVDRKNPRDLEVFMLVLSFIYNEIKGLIIIQNDFYEKYERPILTPDVHTAEYSGIELQYYRMFLSSLFELTEFLKSRKNIIESHNFKVLVSKVGPEFVEIWKGLMSLVNQEDKKPGTFKYVLQRVRNTVTFHYDNKGKIITQGYIKHFFNDATNPFNVEAFYSLADNMEETRFYFADAAVEREMKELAGQYPNFQKEVSDYMKLVATALQQIIKIYLEDTKKGKILK